MKRDIYMNYMVLAVTSTGTSTAMVGGIASNGQINTGMGARTGNGMKIHAVEILHNQTWSGAVDGNRVEVALSTQSARSSMPEIDEKGVIAKWDQVLAIW